MPHDFEKQRQETILVWSDIASRNPNLPAKINLDIHFLPNSGASDKEEFKASLEEVGFLVKVYEDDETVEASVTSITSVDEVWYYEERATKLALIHGFKPDGWGFFTS